MDEKNFNDAKNIVGDYKFGFSTKTNSVFKAVKGLSEQIVRQISEIKGEPKWMLDVRLKAYEAFVNIKKSNMGT